MNVVDTVSFYWYRAFCGTVLFLNLGLLSDCHVLWLFLIIRD